ncbi:MAG: DNA-binding protein WhiA, partial [Clostridia bacterium]|nr:DNA-binding protein WhiA [Clostridia bacterium]
MSFASVVKEELCRDSMARRCCARAEIYGVLLFCNSFTAREIRIVTGTAPFAARLPILFRKAFRLEFDEIQEKSGKWVLLIHRPDKLS